MQSNDNNKNRGAHGDSLRMLGEVSSSNKNPPGFSLGECQYSGNFAKSFKKLNATVDEFLIRSGVASDDLKRYKEEVGIEEKGVEWDD